MVMHFLAVHFKVNYENFRRIIERSWSCIFWNFEGNKKKVWLPYMKTKATKNLHLTLKPENLNKKTGADHCPQWLSQELMFYIAIHLLPHWCQFGVSLRKAYKFPIGETEGQRMSKTAKHLSSNNLDVNHQTPRAGQLTQKSHRVLSQKI